MRSIYRTGCRSTQKVTQEGLSSRIIEGIVTPAPVCKHRCLDEAGEGPAPTRQQKEAGTEGQ